MEKEYSKNESVQKPPASLFACINKLKSNWNTSNEIACIWEDWKDIAGEQLAQNCSPLSLQKGILIVGASHPHWLQALIFNRNQLLASLKAKGHKIKEVRVQKSYFQNKKKLETEKKIWDNHKS